MNTDEVEDGCTRAGSRGAAEHAGTVCTPRHDEEFLVDRGRLRVQLPRSFGETAVALGDHEEDRDGQLRNGHTAVEPRREGRVPSREADNSGDARRYLRSRSKSGVRSNRGAGEHDLFGPKLAQSRRRGREIQIDS